MKQENRTALQVAAHQGHLQVVQVLLNAGAKMEIQDGDGDTAIHYAAFGSVFLRFALFCVVHCRRFVNRRTLYETDAGLLMVSFQFILSKI